MRNKKLRSKLRATTLTKMEPDLMLKLLIRRGNQVKVLRRVLRNLPLKLLRERRECPNLRESLPQNLSLLLSRRKLKNLKRRKNWRCLEMLKATELRIRILIKLKIIEI